jgi:hypothetical protein
VKAVLARRYREFADRGEIFATEFYRRAQHHHVRAAYRAPAAAFRIGDPRHQQPVVEAHDQFGAHRDAAALAAHEPHHVGILAAQRHEIDNARGAVGGFDLCFQDKRGVAIAPRDARRRIGGA